MASLRETGGISQASPNVLLLKIGNVDQQIFDAAARSNRFDNHADGDAHSANARLATQHVRVDGDAPEFLHAS